MKFSTFVSSIHELSIAREYGVKEVLIQEKELSRTGKIDFSEAHTLAKTAKGLGLKTVLVWDVLSTESDFNQQQKYFETLDLTGFDAIRANDPGVIQYLSDKNLKIQISLEMGNHNLIGIKKWASSFKENLDKLILDIELPESKIIQYCNELNVPVEILGVGPILLFYTPRKLLSNQLEKSALKSDEFINAIAESEESPHKGFPVLENKHGTFMFHIKNFFILEYCHKLFDNGLDTMRLDLSDVEMEYLSDIHSFMQNRIDAQTLKKNYSKDTIRGFYHINKSNVLFNKLKNHRIQRKDDSYIGEVVDVIKGRYIVLNVKAGQIKAGVNINYITPEGKELESQIESIWDLDQNILESASQGAMVLINPRNGIWTKSQVYLK